MPAPFNLKQAFPLTIITGHYGVGKTNLALNLAVSWAKPDLSLSLIDLDIVNPYFRSSDSAAWLATQGVTLLGPSLAGSTLDTPALAPGIDETIRQASIRNPVLIDVGGDPDGARALARYTASIIRNEYHLVYLANFNRPEVATAAQALILLQAIEAQSHLRATAIIGNSHLKDESTVEQIISTVPELLELSRISGLPIAAITAPEGLAAAIGQALAAGPGAELAVLPLSIYVKTPWE
ncbi:MAG: hypothetical protein LBU61_04730 [Coriobacteriales bacterium]|jgi:hypothetical protein|nr:hypothetical protein [Coriobacteriales bacterium]